MIIAVEPPWLVHMLQAQLSFDTSIAYTDIINYIRDNSDAAADGLDDKLIWTTGIYQNARGQLNIFKAVEALLKDKGYLDEP